MITASPTQGKFYPPHFSSGKTEAQKGEGTGPGANPEAPRFPMVKPMVTGQSPTHGEGRLYLLASVCEAQKGPIPHALSPPPGPRHPGELVGGGWSLRLLSPEPPALDHPQDQETAHVAPPFSPGIWALLGGGGGGRIKGDRGGGSEERREKKKQEKGRGRGGGRGWKRKRVFQKLRTAIPPHSKWAILALLHREGN